MWKMWEKEFPQVFEKTLCIKLTRIDDEIKNQSESAHNSVKKRGSCISRITRSQKKIGAVDVEWVRVSNGFFKGDVAKLVSIDDEANEAHVKLLPRIDYDSITDDTAESRSKRRPAPKQFDPNAIRYSSYYNETRFFQTNHNFCEYQL